ncbi:MAG: hypothetical protein QOD07_2407 [Frankiaceae bacterium]|nr:hypothetical protein [Frankiaceae bacterium]
MTRRIVAGFLGVLVGLLLLVVVPLGVKISSQQRQDFRANAQSAARAMANTEEERLGDAGDVTAPSPLALSAGDSVVVLDPDGRTLSTAGGRIPRSVLRAVRGRAQVTVPDAVVVTATIGGATHPDGTVVLVRGAEPLDHRIHALWLALAVAAAVTLGLGAVIAVGLARWIGRPLRGLAAAATQMGRGDVGVRTDATMGPPEVRTVAAAFNEMSQRVGALLDSQRTMTADVSHQLRTPLAALRLRLELLAEDSPTNVQSELADALREIGRLNRLLDGLLAVARAEEHVAEPTELDVSGVVAERIETWQPLAAERDIELTSAAEPAVALVTPGHLEQVLDNLIANAMDALAAGGHVTVSVRQHEKDVVLTVADDGPGMASHRRAAAFARFDSDRSGGNAGLGLAIVARLVAADRGSVVLEEAPGGGLAALVRLASVSR